MGEGGNGSSARLWVSGSVSVSPSQLMQKQHKASTKRERKKPRWMKNTPKFQFSVRFGKQFNKRSEGYFQALKRETGDSAPVSKMTLNDPNWSINNQNLDEIVKSYREWLPFG